MRMDETPSAAFIALVRRPFLPDSKWTSYLTSNGGEPVAYVSTSLCEERRQTLTTEMYVHRIFLVLTDIVLDVFVARLLCV